MKKVCYLLWLTLVCHSLNSQSFTNGSVFNFDVGDTIVYLYLEYEGSYSPKQATRISDIVTGKYFSSNQDTITYFITRFRAKLHMNGNEYSSQLVTLKVTNLTDSVSKGHSLQMFNCQSEKYLADTTFCKFPRLIKFAERNPGGCFEAPVSFWTFIDGLGAYYKYLDLKNILPPYGFEYRFENAHKVGSGCGVIGSIANGIKDSDKPQVNLTPNPCNGVILLKSPEAVQFLLYDLHGKLVRDFKVAGGSNQIDLKVPAGVYIVRLMTAASAGYQRLVVQ